MKDSFSYSTHLDDDELKKLAASKSQRSVMPFHGGKSLVMEFSE